MKDKGDDRMDQVCRKIFEKNFPFWEHLNENQKAILCQNTVINRYKKGEIIQHGGENCVGVLLVKSGSIRTYMVSEDGRDITLYRLFKDDICILSASCVINAITFDVFVDAEEDCEVVQIKSCAFKRITEENIYVENYAYKLITTRFSDVMWAFQQILFMSFDRRLAIFLVDELAKTGGNEVKMTHEQIAKYMGSAREVVTRMLKYFANEELVELSRGTIKVLDKKRLRQLT